ncbi:MAG: hypothetical protein RQ862_09500 [Candidatus Caldarchaeales archaeon]|nr:hypothetical protein [Candidatus Caldarchaeales archaeon]
MSVSEALHLVDKISLTKLAINSFFRDLLIARRNREDQRIHELDTLINILWVKNAELIAELASRISPIDSQTVWKIASRLFSKAPKVREDRTLLSLIERLGLEYARRALAIAGGGAEKFSWALLDPHVAVWGKRGEEVLYYEELCSICDSRIDEYGYCGCVGGFPD